MKNRKAVTVILTRDPRSTEIYLVERNQQLRFFGGYFAFPGGTLDEADAGVRLAKSEDVPADSLPYLVAAAREVFEETGILLSRGPRRLAAGPLRRYREELLAGAIDFSEILAREEHEIDARDFHFVESILTPAFAPVRYDTQFYWARLPEDQTPEIIPGELVSGNFFSAEHALDLWRKGEMFIVPPVIFMLREIAGSGLRAGVAKIRRFAEAYRQGAIHEIYFTPGVQMLPVKTRTMPPATHTNAYLVGHEQLYLIDPGPEDETEQERLCQYLDARLEEGCRLQGILLTHHHPDHVGALAECQERYHLPVFAHPHTIDLMPGTTFERALEHGDRLALGPAPDGRADWRLEVFHTPGHAPGHLVFRENRYGSVLAGDMLSALSTIVINPVDGHMGTFMQSLELLETIADGMLYPSHGPAIKTGKAAVRTVIEHRRQREEKVLAALTAAPQTLHDLVRVVYDDVSPVLWSLASLSLHAGLIKLIEEGKCAEGENGFRRLE